MSKIKCNLCGNEAKKFISIKDELSMILKQHRFPYPLWRFETLNYNAYTCPTCGASDRDRLYALYLKKKVLNIRKKITLLDFAPSENLASFIKKHRNVKYRSADLFMDNVDDTVDIQDMNIYPDDTFDFLICSHVLEHVPNDRAALNEINRVLKPGGEAIIMVPIIWFGGKFDEDPDEQRENERWRRFAQYDHIRLYTKKEFTRRVSDSGLIIQTYTARQLGLANFKKFGISARSVLYVMRKQG